MDRSNSIGTGRPPSLIETPLPASESNKMPSPAPASPPRTNRSDRAAFPGLPVRANDEPSRSPVSSFLEDMPPLISAHLAASFTPGGGEAGSLALGNHALAKRWQNEALANKLIVELEHQRQIDDPEIDFARVMRDVQSLPPDLRFGVLELIPRQFFGFNPHRANVAEVLTALLAVTPQLPINQQVAMMDKISAAFAEPTFCGTYLERNADARPIDSVDRAYANFCIALDSLSDAQGWTGTDVVAPAFDAGAASAATNHGSGMRLNTPAAQLKARGVHLVRNAIERDMRWHALLQNVTACTPDQAMTLLDALIPQIDCLGLTPDRHAAMLAVLEFASALPPRKATQVLGSVADHLWQIEDPLRQRQLHDAFKHVAMTMPVHGQADALSLIIDKFPALLGERLLFDDMLQQIPHLPENDRAKVLRHLIGVMFLVPEDARLDAYDAVFAAIDNLPVARQPEVVLRILHGLFFLPHQDAARHLRFTEALEFIEDHPAENKSAMLLALTDAIWTMPAQGAQMQCLIEQLALSRTQDLDFRKRNLQILMDLDGNDEDSETTLDTRYGAARALILEASLLPQDDQAELFGLAASKAIALQGPQFLAQTLKLISRRIRSLPAAQRDAAWQTMHGQLDDLFVTACNTTFMPDTVSRLLNSSTHLPDNPRLQLLKNIHRRLADCNAHTRVAVSQALNNTINALPIALLTRWVGSPYR